MMEWTEVGAFANANESVAWFAADTSEIDDMDSGGVIAVTSVREFIVGCVRARVVQLGLPEWGESDERVR